MSFFANLLGNYITGRLLGGKKGGNIAALGTAGSALFQQGLGSDGFSLESLFGGGKQSDPVTKAVTNMVDPIVQKGSSGLASADATAKAVQASNVARDIAPVFTQGEGTLGFAKALVDSGIMSEGKVADFLNTKAGEGLLSGLGAEVLSMFNKDDEGSTPVSRPFGGEGDVRINIPNKYAAGGYIDDQYFPRRNGGIMPSEGSGQKDDVPAMLMAGEFVLTKDAVKGLGNGDSNRGIEKAYSMMNKLENKADNYV
jgi:hypothetical protein